MTTGKKPGKRISELRELEEFAEKYETFSMIYGDPVEFMFEVMSMQEASIETRKAAAEALMSFRFPKLKAIETKAPPSGPQLALQINLVQNEPTPKRTLDVSPTLVLP